MVRNLRLFVFVLILTPFVKLSAQSDLPTCERQPVLTALEAAVEAIRGASSPDEALNVVQHAIGRYQGACVGLLWSGTGSWVGDLTQFPDGYYVMHFEVDDVRDGATSIRAQIEPLIDSADVLASTCGTGTIYGLRDGQLTRLSACYGYVKIVMRDSLSWRLWLEKLPI